MKPPKTPLAQAFPEIAISWDDDRNENLTPSDVAAFSHKKVWWKCKKCGESWQAAVASRTAGRQSGCGFCAGKRVSPSKSFAALYPHIAAQWDAEKNGSLKPDQVLPKSSRKVWWICPEGHSYKSLISGRTIGKGCPICSGNIVIESTSLVSKFPKLADEWNVRKNFPLTPTEVAPYSHKKVWWICPEGHDYQAEIANRTSVGSSCPYCAGQKVSPETSLLAVNPELAAEWHPTRNHNKLPKHFTANSGFKAWWRCPRGHEWPATISHRQNGSGCPFCGGGVSALEARVYTELKNLFSDVVWHSNALGVQVDVSLPSMGIGVEIDGHYWHSEKVEADTLKNLTCQQQGITLIRLRQHPLQKLGSWDIEYLRSDSDLSVVQRLVSAISSFSANGHVKKIVDRYLHTNNLIAEKDYRKIISNLPSPPDGASFGAIYPEVAEEWHQERNAPLEPSMFAPKANRVVWWQCLAKGHEWKAAIHTRARGIGCPYCANQKIGSDNNLAVLFPDLLREWNYEKNIHISPDKIATNSKIKVWWKCLAKGHEWEALTGNRSRGSGCPYCSGLALTPEKSLATIYPEIAKTWDFEKNAPLRPKDVASQSTKKVWWKCKLCEHSWQSNVQHRVNAKVGCPKCLPAFRGEQMRMARLKLFGTLRQKNPAMAQRWHPTRNENHTPDSLGRNSTKTVWWLCPDCEHEWSVSPNYYRKCPNCGSK